ncbi:MAG: UMP kinase [Gammaproteobacteria bacterium]|nr:UMP kinase [Gammaproteobacteria bacterium]
MSPSEKPIYHRILLKLSGEALLGNQEFGIDPNTLNHISKAIGEIVKLGVEIAIVIGGGNMVRGEVWAKSGLDRVTCDQMGMLATVMNGLVLRDSFVTAGFPSTVMSPVAVQGVVETYDRRRAITYLEKKQIVVFVAGTGCPFFSTDTAASLRAIEVNADIVLKATKVDGIYSSDPKLHKDAKRFEKINYQDVIAQQLRVIDAAAICLCRDHNMPMRVFNMESHGILKRIIMGSNEGTIVS